MFCCVCLEGAEDQLQIFDAHGVKLNIAHIIQQHFWFEPLPDDYTMKTICQECWLKISDFHQFYLLVEEAHLKHHEEMLYAENLKRSIKYENESNPFEAETQLKVEEHSSPLMQTETVMVKDNNPLYEPEVLEEIVASRGKCEDINVCEDITLRDASSEIKYEPEEVEEIDTHNSDDILNPSGSLNDKKGIKSRKRTRKICKKISGDTLSERNTSKGESKNKSSRETKANSMKRLATYAEEDEIIRKHIPLGCDICVFVGENFTDIIRHFREDHPDLKPYVVCCERKLKKRFILVQHAYKHEDPEYFKCQDCHKVFSDGGVLRSHYLAYHAPEDQLRFSCDQCPKKFSRRYLLELHKPTHIPTDERKFICDKCPQKKAFASDHLLQIHVNMRHTKATNVCHVCAKEIRDNKTFAKHVRLHFEDSGPRVKCPRPDCDRWLKDEDNLKTHLRNHNDEGKTFTCDDCGKVCKNRRSLSSHFHYVHSNKVFSCEVCHKNFKRAITLKEHMAQHTGETLYKCPFCKRTFNSNANMHSHKKKMHPIEWDIWRKTKLGGSQHESSNQHVMNVVAALNTSDITKNELALNDGEMQ